MIDRRVWREVVNEPGIWKDVVPLGHVVNAVDVIEQTKRPTHTLVGRGVDAEFLSPATVAVVDLVAVGRRVAGLAVGGRVGVARVVHTAIAVVVGHEQANVGILRIVGLLHRMVILVGRGVDHIQNAKPTLQGQRAQADRVFQGVRAILLDLQIADTRCIVEHTVGLELLIHRHRFERPVIVYLVGYRAASTVVVGVVVVVFDERIVADRPAQRHLEAATGAGGGRNAVEHTDARLDRLLNQQRVSGRQAARTARIPRHPVRSGDIVDIAALMIAVER